MNNKERLYDPANVGLTWVNRNRWAVTLVVLGGASLSLLSASCEDPKDYITMLTPGGISGAQPPDQSSTVDPQIAALEEAIKAAALRQPEPIITVTDRNQAIVNHMATYLGRDLGARTIERFNKLWEVLPVPDPLQIVLEADPINVRDFPDTRLGRQINNAKPIDGYYKKVLRANLEKNPIPGIYQQFIFIRTPQTLKVESIWAVLDLIKDPTDIKGEKMEVFAVYHTAEKDPYLASFISEGISLKGEDIFGRYLNQGRKTADGARIYDNGAIGPNRVDLAWLNSIR